MLNNYTDVIQYQSCSVILKETQESGCLLVGDFNSPTDQKIIQKYQIKTIITAALGLQHLNISSQINHIVYPLLDSKNFNIYDFFQTCTTTIDENIKKGGVLVHCSAGISRSATLVIAYLMKKKKIGFRQAISLVRKKRKNICPNLGFQRQLKQYQKQTILNRLNKQQKKHASLHNYNLPKKNRFSIQNYISSKKKIKYSKTPQQQNRRDILVSVYNNRNNLCCFQSCSIQQESKVLKKSNLKLFQEKIKNKLKNHICPKLKIMGSYQDKQNKINSLVKQNKCLY